MLQRMDLHWNNRPVFIDNDNLCCEKKLSPTVSSLVYLTAGILSDEIQVDLKLSTYHMVTVIHKSKVLL